MGLARPWAVAASPLNVRIKGFERQQCRNKTELVLKSSPGADRLLSAVDLSGWLASACGSRLGKHVPCIPQDEFCHYRLSRMLKTD